MPIEFLLAKQDCKASRQDQCDTDDNEDQGQLFHSRGNSRQRRVVPMDSEHVVLRDLVPRDETKRLFRKLLGHLLSSVRRIDPIRRLPWEANMRLKDLIDLFVDDNDDDKVRRPDDEFVPRESRDTSSLADIVRILRELDGQHDTRR